SLRMAVCQARGRAAAAEAATGRRGRRRVSYGVGGGRRGGGARGVFSRRSRARVWGGARVAGELLRGGKSGDIADLEGDDDSQREPNARHGQEPLNRRRRLERGSDALLELGPLAVQPLDRVKKLLAGRGLGLRRPMQ